MKVLDATGKQIHEYRYGAYGNLEYSKGSSDNRYVYTGKEWDAESGFFYFGARYYDPSIGRWISQDPMDEFFTEYSYVGNDPLHLVDPWGLNATDSDGGALGDGESYDSDTGDCNYKFEDASSSKPKKSEHLNSDELSSTGKITGSDVLSVAAVALTALRPTFMISAAAISMAEDYVSSVATKQRDFYLEKYNDSSGIAAFGWASLGSLAQLATPENIMSTQIVLTLGVGSGLGVVRNGPKMIGKFKNFLKHNPKLFNKLAKTATQNPNSDRVVLGKFFPGSKFSYNAIAKRYNATYFHLKNWNAIQKVVGKENMWKINKAFLKQQIKQGKQIWLAHDPFSKKFATGYYKQELDVLRKLYDFKKVGNMWKCVPKK